VGGNGQPFSVPAAGGGRRFLQYSQQPKHAPAASNKSRINHSFRDDSELTNTDADASDPGMTVMK
jgi:hypothetical protein